MQKALSFPAWFQSNRLFVVALCLTIVGCLYTTYALIPVHTAAGYVVEPAEYVKSSRGDIDVNMLLTSIDNKPTFVETFDWWTESWTLLTAYWRPLTMQTLWIQWHVFGAEHYEWLHYISGALNLAFLGLLGLWVHRISNRRDLALLCVILFGCYRFYIPFSTVFFSGEMRPPSGYLLNAWKDQPDLWTDCLILGAMLSAVSKKWWGFLVCGALAICFKESGWLTLPLTAISLIAVGELKSIPKWVYLAGGILVTVLILLRWSAGPEVFRGYRLGHNYYWYLKFLSATQGKLIGFMIYKWTACIVVATVAAMIILRRPKNLVAAFLLVIASLVVEMFLLSWTEGVPHLTAFGLVMDPQVTLFPSGFQFLAVLAVWWILKEPSLRKVSLVCFILGLVAASQYAAAAHVRSHVLYLAAAFQTVVIASLLIIWGERILLWIQTRQRRMVTVPGPSSEPMTVR